MWCAIIPSGKRNSQKTEPSRRSRRTGVALALLVVSACDFQSFFYGASLYNPVGYASTSSYPSHATRLDRFRAVRRPATIHGRGPTFPQLSDRRKPVFAETVSV